MGEAIVFALISAVLLWAVVAQFSASAKFGVSATSPTFTYDGGHPELAPGPVKVWSKDNSIMVGRFGWFGDTSVVSIPFESIVSLSLNANVQNVAVGGGRSIGGALIGGAIAGPVGALVGSRSASEIKRIDESKCYLYFMQNGVQLQMVFAGGQQTYNSLAPLFSSIPQPAAPSTQA